ncbi:HAD family hydrolase [Nocardia nova]
MNETWLVLDVDDTLVDTFRTGLEKCRAVAARLGLAAPTPAEFAAAYGRLGFSDCVRTWHPGVDVLRYSAEYDALSSLFPPLPIGDVVAAVDAAMAAGLRTAVLTNGPAAKTQAKLAALGIVDRFDFVLHGDNLRFPKPDAASFEQLVERCGVAPQHIWYVTDQPAEWRAAMTAGIRTVGVVTGSAHVRGNGTLPQVVVPQLAGLVNVFEALFDAMPAPEDDVSAVTFDIGFTLLHHHRAPETIVADFLAARGAAVELESAAEAIRSETALLDDVTRSWFDADAVQGSLEKLYGAILYKFNVVDRGAAKEIIDRYCSFENWYAYDGAVDFVERVRRRGWVVGALSNWQPSLLSVLSANGFDGLFDALAISTVIGAAKPDRAAFDAAAAALGVPIQRLLHIGDDAHSDIGGALAAGCRSILLTDGPATPAARHALEVLTR